MRLGGFLSAESSIFKCFLPLDKYIAKVITKAKLCAT